MGSSRAKALVVSARQRAASGGAYQGDPFWWQEALGSRFGKTVWVMELDVHPASGAAYRVQGEFKVPNKLFKVRNVLKGRPSFPPGLSLPVTVEDGDPSKVTIDWSGFEAEGGVERLYPHDESVTDTVRDFVAELRSKPTTPEPDVPRPSAATHPPVEGVDYDQWVDAVLTLTRRMDFEARDTHYQARGFPVGRGDAISTVWFERVQADPTVNAWFLYDQASR
jgi:hypothetical protein